VHNEENARNPDDYRTGHGQTGYKRALGYQHLGIRPQDVECFPFFPANLRRIGRLLNQGRAKDAPLVHPFDVLQSSEHEEARRLWSVYDKVPASFRRLMRPEAFCLAARVDPARVVGWITEVAVRQGAQASAILSAVWTPRLVQKSIERGLQNGGVKDRQTMFRAVGLIPPRG
jgi:hypothetical protein